MLEYKVSGYNPKSSGLLFALNAGQLTLISLELRTREDKKTESILIHNDLIEDLIKWGVK
jgi:hypothetical protein